VKSPRPTYPYIKVNGVWKYLYRSVDRQGDTVDFLLTAKRDLAAARRFFERAMGQHDLPESITIDKSGANTAAINSVIADTDAAILMRQCRYLNNIVEQDHRAIKRVTRPMMGFKNFHFAQSLIAGIETMHMIRKGQMKSGPKGQVLYKAEQFYSLAF
jgi:transposase-like protein